jgi:hypothetical protein
VTAGESPPAFGQPLVKPLPLMQGFGQARQKLTNDAVGAVGLKKPLALKKLLDHEE